MHRFPGFDGVAEKPSRNDTTMTSMQGGEPPHLTRMGGWHVMPQAADLFPLSIHQPRHDSVSRHHGGSVFALLAKAVTQMGDAGALKTTCAGDVYIVYCSKYENIAGALSCFKLKPPTIKQPLKCTQSESANP